MDYTKIILSIKRTRKSHPAKGERDPTREIAIALLLALVAAWIVSHITVQ